MPENATISTVPGAARWHVIRTRSNCERLVHGQLTGKGFDVLFPTVDAWSRRGRHRHLLQVPMFPGYVFLHHEMDKASYLEVCRSIGLVSILGDRWDRLEVVPESEIGAIQQTLRAGLPIFPYPYLQEGQRVRIVHGPLADVEGILVRGNPKKGILVISISMLRRSMAVEVDCTQVLAA